MNDELKRVAADIKVYLQLCEQYQEEYQTRADRYGNQIPDCYGPHATILHLRAKRHPVALKTGASGKAASRRSTTQRRLR